MARNKSSVDPGRVGRKDPISRTKEGDTPALHEPVSGEMPEAPDGSVPAPAEELPPFDESRAVPAETLSYGDPAPEAPDGRSSVDPGRIGRVDTSESNG
jgi:hypothetical protein